MLTLIKYEFIKLFQRVKTIVVIVAFILLTAVMAYGLHHDSENMKKYNSPEFRIKNMEENIKYNEEAKNNLPPDIKGDAVKTEEYIKNLDEHTAQMKDEISKLKALNGKDVDWREGLKLRIQELEKITKENSGSTKGDMSNMLQELETLKYLQAKDIKPTDYTDFNAYIFLEKLIQILSQVFLVIGIAIFVSDMVSGESTPPTLKLLLTQPVSRGKVLLSKFVAISLAAVGCILAIEALAFVVVGLIYGFGNSSYPVLVGAKFQFDKSIFLDGGGHPLALIAGSSHIIPIWQYTLNILLIEALFIVACTAFCMLISTLFKTSMVSMGVSTVSLIAMTIVFNIIGSLKKYSIYVFTSYMDLGSVIKGDVVRQFNNPNVSMAFVITMFAVWTIVCYLISHFVFSKKDILI